MLTIDDPNGEPVIPAPCGFLVVDFFEVAVWPSIAPKWAGIGRPYGFPSPSSGPVSLLALLLFVYFPAHMFLGRRLLWLVFPCYTFLV